MEHEIKWESDMDAALAKAKDEDKAILLEFFDPNCIGCQQMDKITFPDDKVNMFIDENMIALRVPHDAKPLAEDFNIHWTPTFIMLDSKGKEHYRSVGFLSPEEFIPALMLSIDKMYFDADQFDDALTNIDRLLSDYPESASAPEAVYLWGVSRFKKNHDAKMLKDAYERLQHDYPGSEWAKRANPYRLL